MPQKVILRFPTAKLMVSLLLFIVSDQVLEKGSLLHCFTHSKQRFKQI